MTKEAALLHSLFKAGFEQMLKKKNGETVVASVEETPSM